MKAMRIGSVRTFCVLGLVIIMTGSVFAASNIYDFTCRRSMASPCRWRISRARWFWWSMWPAAAAIPRNTARWRHCMKSIRTRVLSSSASPPTISAHRNLAPTRKSRLSVPASTTSHFPLYSKVSVKGDDQTPLYQYLTKQTDPSIAGEIKWNFTKFLVDRNGQRRAAF